MDRIGALKGALDICQHFGRKTSRKLKGGPFAVIEKFSKKVSQCRKTLKGVLWSRPEILLGEKKEQPFWFSSLGQMLKFDTIKFRRTTRNYFGQFVWIQLRFAS